MKRLLIVLGMCSLLFLIGCKDDRAAATEETEQEQEEEDATVEGKLVEEEKDKKVKGTVDPKDFDKMYSNPKSYENFEVEFTGSVFIEPERDDEGVYLQVHANPEKYEQNIIVGFQHPEFDVNIDDYVKVKGIVRGEFEGENYLGGTVNAPKIEATDIEIVDYITAVSPTIKTIDLNETMEQHEVEILLQKIEIAESETRVYIEVTNNTDNTMMYDSYSAKLIVGNQQLELADNFESGLPEIPFEILSGIKSEGVLTFPAIEEDTNSVTLHTEAHTDNYNIDFKPFVFEVEF